MNPIIIAALVVVGIGAFCALALVIASKFLAVEENETAKKIRECLPGANCGACGYAGCDGYANALAEELEQRFPDCDINMISGEQPVYYYIISIE